MSYLIGRLKDRIVTEYKGALLNQGEILRVPITSKIELLEVSISRGKAGTSGDTTVDVLTGTFGTTYSASSVFTQTSHRPTLNFSTGDNSTAYSTGTLPIEIPANTILTLNIVDLEEGGAEDLLISLIYRDI
jgi:hypothetical protein